MTDSKLREQFARRRRVQAVDHASSGSPAALILRPGPDMAARRTIDATIALARRGLTMLKAKRAVEAAIERGEIAIDVPMVENLTALAGDLQAAGFCIARLTRDAIDVRAIREGLRMTQEQFALRFNLDVDSIRNWEQGRFVPDRASTSYLRVIARQPDAAAACQEEAVE